jgi:hypothetical protein
MILIHTLMHETPISPNTLEHWGCKWTVLANVNVNANADTDTTARMDTSMQCTSGV